MCRGCCCDKIIRISVDLRCRLLCLTRDREETMLNRNHQPVQFCNSSGHCCGGDLVRLIVDQ